MRKKIDADLAARLWAAGTPADQIARQCIIGDIGSWVYGRRKRGDTRFAFRQDDSDHGRQRRLATIASARDAKRRTKIAALPIIDQVARDWLAGVIDSTGFLGIDAHHAPTYDVSTTWRALAARLYVIAGGTVFRRRLSRAKVKHRWRLVGDICVHVLAQVVSHLHVRRRLAELVIAYPRVRQGARLDAEVIARRQEITDEISHLSATADLSAPA